jgi:hypothetical protein
MSLNVINVLKVILVSKKSTSQKRLFQQTGLLLLLFFLIIVACRKETFYSGHDATLKFSDDTVTFDTIFTNIGTATKRLMVYNPYNKSLKISNIQIANGETPFIFNINGKQATSVNDIEIYPKDSLYIFIQVLVNTTGQNSPLLIHDLLEFTVNGNIQNVELEAYGQDVHLIRHEIIKTTTWDNDKPYLIYGDLIVDTLETLTINKGVRVFFHRESNMLVKGTLKINGDFENPVVFQGDRLEKYYQEYPGQWGGVLLNPGSKNNIFNWLVIKNGTTGIQIGADNDLSKPDVELYNVIVQNMSSSCLLAKGARVKAANCLIANAATYTCGLLGGGEYEFYQCTFANYYGSYSSRQYSNPTVYITNYYTDTLGKTIVSNLDSANFYNSIIYGGNADEILLAKHNSSALFQYKFDHCLLKSHEYNSTSPLFINNIWNKDPKFHASDSLKFELDSLSSAIDEGSADIGKLHPMDLKNKSRISDKAPDLGAYEWIKQ